MTNLLADSGSITASAGGCTIVTSSWSAALLSMSFFYLCSSLIWLRCFMLDYLSFSANYSLTCCSSSNLLAFCSNSYFSFSYFSSCLAFSWKLFSRLAFSAANLYCSLLSASSAALISSSLSRMIASFLSDSLLSASCLARRSLSSWSFLKRCWACSSAYRLIYSISYYL